MEKVEAYRCEECEGESRVMGEKTVISKGLGGIETSSKYPMLVDCPHCNGTGVVWLTKEEAHPLAYNSKKPSPLEDVPPEMVVRAAVELKTKEDSLKGGE